MELDLRQYDVANILGVCEDTITGWENGRSVPQIQFYPSLIQFLGYNPFPVDESTLGGRIRKFRVEHGVSQEKLALLLGVDETTIRSWEKDIHVPFPKKLKQLEEIINQKELSK